MTNLGHMRISGTEPCEPTESLAKQSILKS